MEAAWIVNVKTSVVLGSLFLVLLFSPYLIIAFETGSVDLKLTSSDLYVLWFTILQAFLSSMLSIALGVLGALSLLKCKNQYPNLNRTLLRPLCLLPNIVPVLLVLLASLQMINPFPFGLFGIVLIHGIINIGIVSLSLEKIIRNKLSGLSEIAELLGEKSKFRFLKIGLGVIRSDLILLFMFVFAICYSSFAVPLVVGGSQATTIEVLIYEEIRISGNWSKALSLSILQSIVLFVLCFSIPFVFVKERIHFRKCRLLHSWVGLPMNIVPGVIIVLGLILSLPMGWMQLKRVPSLQEELGGLFLNSMFVGIGTGVLTLSLLLLLAFLYLKGLQSRIALSYVAPSTVICGFALLFLGNQSETWSLYRIVLGLTLISVPALFRLSFAGKLYGIESQREVGESLGGTSSQVFKWIVLPQVFPNACFLSGIAAFWAWGDFALSNVVSDRALTLSLVIQQLMGSYRLELATLLVWIVIFGGMLSFFLFSGLGYVYDKKIVSKF